MGKKLKIFISVILLMIMVGSIYIYFVNRAENEIREGELAMHREQMTKKLQYGDRMFFDSNYHTIGAAASRMMFGRFDELVDVVFVHSEEENVDFPPYVLVAWPSDITVAWVNDLNRRVRIDYLEELGIHFPLTLEFVVEEWETMNEIWTHLGDTGNFMRRSFESAWWERLRNETEVPVEENVTEE